MASNPQSTIVDRKQIIVSSLCEYLNLDSKTFIADAAEHDVKSLCSNILKSSGKTNDEVLSWVAFADSFPLDSKTCLGSLGKLNEELASKSVLGDGLKPSAADVIVFSAVHSAVVGLSSSARQKLPHVLRWMDYIQNKVNFGESFEKISLEKAGFEPYVLKSVAGVEVDSNAKKAGQTAKVDEKQGEKNSKKTDDQKVSGKKEATKEKKKSAEPEKKKSTESEASDKDKELSVSLLNIKVGLIRKAWKHPSADSLLVEEIDVGEAKLRQVVSGLAKFCSPDELTNRRIVLITNVKPGKLRDVMSEGLVLCASNEDHSVVEPLLPPEGSKVGEQVTFSGIDGKPEDVLNPKKKQLEKITPNLYTDEKGVATFKGLPFMTSGGPCTSSIPKASIK